MRPPALAEWLLARAIGSRASADAVVGDLHEEFARAGAAGRRATRLWYWTQAVRLAARYAAVRTADRLTRRAPPAPTPP